MPRTSSMDTERSGSGKSVVPDTEWAIDFGEVGFSIMSDGL